MSDLAELVRQLVAIDSVNPMLVSGGAGEPAIARFVAEWLERAGLEVRLEEAAPGRPNVIGVARGSGGGRTLLLNAHTDTVGVAGMERAHEPWLENGRLYGRGAYDMKSGLAAAMMAAASARGLAGDVVVAAVVDEEAAASGTKALVGGIDAITRMGPVLVELSALADRLRRARPHRLLGTGSVHASLIEGGQEYSSYPERCLLTGEWRTLPGQSPNDVLAELRELIARSGVDAELRLLFTGAPFECADDEEIVRLVHGHAKTAIVGVPYWADSALLAEAGIATVLIGPCGGGEHELVEWVELASVERLRDVLLATAQDFCGKAG